MLAPGDTFAGYTVVRALGSGGMGAVYLVRHPRLPRTDAMKVLRRELRGDDDFTRRFLREAELVAGLSHRNVVPVLDRGEDDGQLWLTMPFVDGTDAEAALTAAGGRFAPDRAVYVVGEVAAALDAAHRQGLVHRDVKPANVLLRPAAHDEPEQVFLTDFGIAKPLEAGSTRLTRTGMVVATFDYASPEQIESRELSPRSDVYSLGCVLYRLLTGAVPFPGDTLFAALHGHVALPPPRPSASVAALPAGLDEVVARAMAKDPADRYPTCRALAAAARTALAGAPRVPRAAPAPPTVVHRTSAPTPPPPRTDQRATAQTDHLHTDHRHTDHLHADPLHPDQVPTDHLPAAPRSTDPLPPAPWTPHPSAAPPPPSSRRRTALVVGTALLTAVAVAVALVLVLGDRDGSAGSAADAGSGGAATSAAGSAGAGSTAVTPTAPTGPAVTALAALPRSVVPLADSAVLVVRAGGTADLFAVDSVSGDAVQLTSGADSENSPVLSPDRRTLGYLSTAADGSSQLRVMPTDGGASEPLFDPLPTGCTRALRPAWDPVDPTRLALPCAAADGSRVLLVVTLDGTVVSRLEVGPFLGDVAFSPDGSEVVYWSATTADRDGGSLWATAADGSTGPRQITDVADGVDADPEWSSAGIVFRRAEPDGSRSICVVQPDGSGLRALTSGGYDEDPTWSPDGGRIAYKSRENAPDGLTRMWTVGADGSGAAQLGRPDDEVDEQSEPAWGLR